MARRAQGGGLMTWPPETDDEKRAAHQRQLAVAKHLAFIESFRPLPKPGPPTAQQLREKAEALAFIETFRPWWCRD